jgi:uncharacterized membrane protein AbrB (regulator of aidB expression)
MHATALQTPSPISVARAVCAGFIASTWFEQVVRTRVDRLSRRTLIVTVLLAAIVIALLVELSGADVRAGLAGSRPGAAAKLLRFAPLGAMRAS